jgi:hypothetical protein
MNTLESKIERHKSVINDWLGRLAADKYPEIAGKSWQEARDIISSKIKECDTEAFHIAAGLDNAIDILDEMIFEAEASN